MLGDQGWKRHANQWSVWTRFAAIPAMIAAVWSRAVLGAWAWLPVGVVVLWLILNPFVFAPVTTPTRWVEKGIYGERLWLERAVALAPAQRTLLVGLVGLGGLGMALLVHGLVALSPWPTAFGATLVVVAQLWRIDRFSLLYDEHQRLRDPAPPV